MSDRRTQLALMVFVLLVTSALSIPMLGADILFVDEYWSIRNSGGTFGPLGLSGIWERTATVDPGGMGVLYHWFLGGWEYLIGITTFSVRAFSLCAGLIGIASLYRLGKHLFSPEIGLYAGAILALSAFYIDYLHEARAYSLLACLAIWAVYCYVQIMGHKQAAHWGWYVGLATMLAALAYTHYVALAMGAVLGAYHLTQFNNSRKWWLVVGWMTVGGLIFLPWFNVTLEVIQRGTVDTGRQANSMNSSQIVQNLAHTVSNANLALLALLTFYSLRTFTRKTLLICIWILVAVLLVIIVNQFIPFMVHLRYLMFVLPAFALLLALGISKMKQFRTAVLLVWLGAGIYQSLNPQFINTQFGQIYRAPADGFERTLDVLNQRAQAQDLALYHIMTPGFEPFNYFPLDYYFRETDIMEVDVRFDQIERIANSFAGGDVSYLADVEMALSDVDSIWTGIIPDLPSTQRSGVVEYVLATQYSLCETVFEQTDMQMQLWVRPGDIPPIARFGDLELFNFERGYLTEDTVHLVLGWWADQIQPQVYSIGLHLFDENDSLVRQQDIGLPDERPFTCTSATLNLDGLSPGNYTLRVTVYEWQTGNRLSTADDRDYADVQSIVIR